MSNKPRKKSLSLKVFKQRVGCVLESITQLNHDDRSEAFGFLQNCVSFLDTRKSDTSYPEEYTASVPDSTSSEKEVIPDKTDKDLKVNCCDLPQKTSTSKEFYASEEKTDLANKNEKYSQNRKSEIDNLGRVKLEEVPIRDIQDDNLVSDSSLKLEGTQNVQNSSKKGFKESSLSRRPSQTFKCTECGAKVKSRKAMINHLNKHSSIGVSCRLCRKTFSSLEAFNFHFDEFCDGKNLVCPQCQESFSCQLYLNNHMDGHNRNNCQECPALFTNRKNLVAHMAEVHSVVMLADAAFQCSVKDCHRRFVKRSTLHRHMQLRHTTKDERVCITCGLYLKGDTAYKEHIKTHQQWSCKECSESFTRRQQYLVHMASHEQSKYRCITCSLTVPTKSRILEHRKDGHEVEGPNIDYACEKCEKRFMAFAEWRDHCSEHKQTLIKSFTCEYCKKIYPTKKAFTNHIRNLHGFVDTIRVTGEGSLICEQCGKQFRQPCLLAKHLKSVHNEQTFSCKFCDFKTNYEVNFKRHLALHTQDQQYVCDQCGASFQALSTLKDHNLFVHSDERNFTCDVCKKAFKRKNDLTRHYRSHSDDRMYVCHCKQSYKFMSHLRRHQESAHKTVSNSRKVERLVTDPSGKLVQKPKPNKEKKALNKLKLEFCEISESSTGGEKVGSNNMVGSRQPGQAMQLLTVDDHQVVALSVTDLQISDQNVDPYSIQVSYEGLNFSDSKTQLIYAASPQVMSLQLPQFELVQPNLAFDTNAVMDSSENMPEHSHESMLLSTPVMSIATSEHESQPVMTLITGLDQNTMFNSQSDIGTMTEYNPVFDNAVLESNSVDNGKSEGFSNSSVIVDHKTNNQTNISTMTDVYSSVFANVSPTEHQELTAMNFTQLEEAQTMLMPSSQDWPMPQEPVTLPQYSTC